MDKKQLVIGNQNRNSRKGVFLVLLWNRPITSGPFCCLVFGSLSVPNLVRYYKKTNTYKLVLHFFVPGWKNEKSEKGVTVTARTLYALQSFLLKSEK